MTLQILGPVTVYKCDSCKAWISVADWHAVPGLEMRIGGDTRHLCLVCCTAPVEVVQEILDDLLLAFAEERSADDEHY